MSFVYLKSAIQCHRTMQPGYLHSYCWGPQCFCPIFWTTGFPFSTSHLRKFRTASIPCRSPPNRARFRYSHYWTSVWACSQYLRMVIRDQTAYSRSRFPPPSLLRCHIIKYWVIFSAAPSKVFVAIFYSSLQSLVHACIPMPPFLRPEEQCRLHWCSGPNRESQIPYSHGTSFLNLCTRGRRRMVS